MLDLVLCVCTEYIAKCVTIITRIIRPITKLNSIYVSTIYKGKKKKKNATKINDNNNADTFRLAPLLVLGCVRMLELVLCVCTE